MDQKTLKVTQGALLAAVFGVLVFLNRQTAGIVQEFLIYIYPLPVAVYTARYGWKAGVPAAVAMALLAFFLGTPAYAFYSGMCLLTGLVFGQCLNRKVPAEKMIFLIMLSSIAMNLLSLLFAEAVSGISMQQEAEELKQLMEEMLGTMAAGAGTAGAAGSAEDAQQAIGIVQEMFTMDYLKRIIIVSSVLGGGLQGFLTYELGLLIMRRLKIRVPQPKSVYSFRPPVWTAYLALAGFLVYTFGMNRVMDNEQQRNILMTVGLAAGFYLMIFGVIGISRFLSRRMPEHRFLAGLLAFLSVFILPFLDMIAGYLYITGMGGLPLPAPDSGTGTDAACRQKQLEEKKQ